MGMPTMKEIRELIPCDVNDATVVSMAFDAGLITREERYEITRSIPLGDVVSN